MRATDGSEQMLVTLKRRTVARRRFRSDRRGRGGGTPAPSCGDKMTVHALCLPRDPEQMYVATRFMRDGKERQLRGPNNVLLWTVKTIETDGKTLDTPYSAICARE